METEEWRVVPIATNYMISSAGRLKRTPGHRCLKERFLKGAITPNLRLHYAMCVDGRMVQKYAHQLVALAFLGPPPSESHVVAHNDGNALNNSPSNLRWATQAENCADRVLHGTAQIGERHWKARLTEEDIRYIRAQPAKFGSGTALAKKFGVTKTQISYIRNRKTWTHI